MSDSTPKVLEQNSQPINNDVTQVTNISWLTFGLSAGSLLLFVCMALLDLEALSAIINTAYAWSADLFGAAWQIFLLLSFLVAMYIAVAKTGGVRMGNTQTPEMNTFKWFSIIMCTLLAGGGVFFAAAEPMSHFLAPPPLYTGAEAATQSAVYPALEIGSSTLGWVVLLMQPVWWR